MSHLWRLVWIQAVSRIGFYWRLWERIVPWFSSSFWWLLIVFVIPWLFHINLYLCLNMVFSLKSLSLCLLLFNSGFIVDEGPILFLYDFIPTNYICSHPISTSWCSRKKWIYVDIIQTSTILLWWDIDIYHSTTFMNIYVNSGWDKDIR